MRLRQEIPAFAGGIRETAGLGREVWSAFRILMFIRLAPELNMIGF